MSTFKLGNIELENPIMLAPMAGVTDKSFRKICRTCGAEFTVSEMLSAKALCYEQLSKKENFESKTAPLASLCADEHPSAVQIFGCEPSFMAEAAARLEELDYKGCTSQIKPSAIDINMGCPVHKIVSNGEGSALMKNPKLAAEIVSATVKALKHTPVTVKIRAGWDDSSKNAPEMAKMLEAAGATLVCVHARTREQMYNPGVDISIIEKVKNAVSIPVIGNGDVNCFADAESMMARTGCDGIMIGRGALGNPWIFEEIASRKNGEIYTAPTLKEAIDTCLYHVELMRKSKGERVASAEIKKHAALYIKGVRGAASIRDSIMKTTSTSEIEELLFALKERDGDDE